MAKLTEIENIMNNLASQSKSKTLSTSLSTNDQSNRYTFNLVDNINLDMSPSRSETPSKSSKYFVWNIHDHIIIPPSYTTSDLILDQPEDTLNTTQMANIVESYFKI